MKLIKVTGIVIQEVKYKDNNKILTILTDKLGKISCLARGSRKINSPLLASSQLLVVSEFVLYKGTNYYNINTAEVIDTFYNIRTDYEKLEKAYNILKIVSLLTYEEESKKILSLVLNTIYVLSNFDKDFKFIETVFKLKIISLIGFKPSVVSCKECNVKIKDDSKLKSTDAKLKEEKTYLYNFATNNMICNECFLKLDDENKLEYIRINEAVYLAICFVLAEDTKKIYSFKLKQEKLNELERFVEKVYVNIFR